MSGEWWREAAWMVLPDGTPYINPQTRIMVLGRGYRLTSHKLAAIGVDFSIVVTVDHPLGAEAQRVA